MNFQCIDWAFLLRGDESISVCLDRSFGSEPGRGRNKKTGQREDGDTGSGDDFEFADVYLHSIYSTKV